MAALYRLKMLRLRLLGAVGDPHLLLKPYSHFSLLNQNQLQFVRHLTITTTISPPEISPENQQHSNFTLNYLINSCGLSPEGAILASKRIKLNSSENADKVLGILRNHGLSETHISRVVRSSYVILRLDPVKILLPKIEYLRSIGLSNEDLAKLLASNPTILTSSLQKRIIPTFDFLRSMLTSKNALSVFKSGAGSGIFCQGPSKNVVPNIELLRELGMPQSCISLLLANSTRALMCKPEKFRDVVNEVKQMSFNLQKSTSVSAIRALCASKSIWNRSRQVYMTRWGWSDDDVLSAFRKNPNCMVMSEKKIMQVMELLVDKMGWPSQVIAKYPLVMSYSLDKRIIPRCSVIQVFLMKGFINQIQNVSLASLLCPAEEYFLERFVAKYVDQVPQLLSVYQGKVRVEDV